MNHSGRLLKNISGIGMACMLILFALTGLWYQQRFFFSDTNFILFQIFNTGKLSIQEHRYGSFITQMVPWTAQYIGASLKTGAVLYSMSFFAFYTTVYAVLFYSFKNYGLCILMLAYHTLFVGDVLFWPNNEVHQGIAWMFLLLGFYQYAQKKRLNNYVTIAVSVVLLSLASVTHLLVSVPLLFIWVCYHIYGSERLRFLKSRTFWLGCILILAAVLIRYKMSRTSGGYDNDKLSVLSNWDVNTILGAFNTPHAQGFYKTMWLRYSSVIILFLLGTIFLVKRGTWVALITYYGALAGYWVIFNTVFPYAADRFMYFYLESEYMAAAVIISLPAVYAITQSKKPSLPFSYGILAFVLITTGLRISAGYNFFDHRLDNLKNVVTYMDQNDIRKGIAVMEEDRQKSYFIMAWGMPIETLSYALINGYKPVTLKIVSSSHEPYQYELLSTQPATTFLSCFIAVSAADVSSRYFPVDTTVHYKPVSGDIIDLLQPLLR